MSRDLDDFGLGIGGEGFDLDAAAKNMAEAMNREIDISKRRDALQLSVEAVRPDETDADILTRAERFMKFLEGETEQ